jgi:mannose-1-phosphate guanylyltransferase
MVRCSPSRKSTLDSQSSFGRAPMKWIGHAVMEHTERAAVVPVDLGWSDVRS